MRPRPGEVQRRLCEQEAGSASPQREGCTVAAEAPTSVARRKNQRAVQKTDASYVLVSKMQMSCCEILIHSFTNLNIYKGIKFLKLEVLNNYHKETFTVPIYEVTSMSIPLNNCMLPYRRVVQCRLNIGDKRFPTIKLFSFSVLCGWGDLENGVLLANHKST